jgi:hypothetical protein
MDLCPTTLPLQGGRNTSDARLPAEAPASNAKPILDQQVLKSLAHFSVRAMLREPADRNWMERYYVVSQALGYRLRSRAVATAALAVDLKRFYGRQFLDLMCVPVDLAQKSPWPALLVRPGYPTRLSPVKHVLFQTFLKHAQSVENLDHARYRRPGPSRRDYRLVDRQALKRMRLFLKKKAKTGRKLTVGELREASKEQACLHRFKERFPMSRRFLARFRYSVHSVRRLKAKSGSNAA